MKSILLIGLLFLSGCAITPLTQGGPARPLGKGALEAGLQWSGYRHSTGSYVLVPMGKVRYGLTDEWTLAAQSELKTVSLSGQNAYYRDAESGWFASVEAGFAYVAASFSPFVGHWVSAKKGNWEPFLGLQLFLANLEPGQFAPSFFTVIPPFHGFFALASVGTRYWITADLGVGLHFNWLFSTQAVVFQSPFNQNVSAFLTW